MTMDEQERHITKTRSVNLQLYMFIASRFSSWESTAPLRSDELHNDVQKAASLNQAHEVLYSHGMGEIVV